jgi:hypothetical protein
MTTLDIQRLHRFRAETFHTLPGKRLHSREEAVDFVNQRGFIYFWPIKGITMPSLWAAVAGDRQVANAHDDPGHVTWGWKDSLLGQRVWYYAKVLRKKATIISLADAPYFYALSENYGSPEEDYLTLYEQGRLTLESRVVYEAVLDHGPLDTIALRREAHMTSTESDSRFNRAITDLQADFKVVPVGVAQAGAWNYAFIYDVAARHYPELPEQAQHIPTRQARLHLAQRYLESVGAIQARDLSLLFHWRPIDIERTLNQLVESGKGIPGVNIEGVKGESYVLPYLLENDS